eukprot:CAMPEP_0172837788 /NCGR_PEP_ID=MMETSP1075-20121228/27446_1 /TAXON_ID=2916 /ORGANISM="Ceratium fusus, Strain PA161109" /LENGTH=897 /DNA_ID=CAMNT_0013681223 /DNA_START=50 /DNA_END=2743 /DNA_ORIENTATION=+
MPVSRAGSKEPPQEKESQMTHSVSETVHQQQRRTARKHMTYSPGTFSKVAKAPADNASTASVKKIVRHISKIDIILKRFLFKEARLTLDRYRREADPVRSPLTKLRHAFQAVRNAVKCILTRMNLKADELEIEAADELEIEPAQALKPRSLSDSIVESQLLGAFKETRRRLSEVGHEQRVVAIWARSTRLHMDEALDKYSCLLDRLHDDSSTNLDTHELLSRQISESVQMTRGILSRFGPVELAPSDVPSLKVPLRRRRGSQSLPARLLRFRADVAPEDASSSDDSDNSDLDAGTPSNADIPLAPPMLMQRRGAETVSPASSKSDSFDNMVKGPIQESNHPSKHKGGTTESFATKEDSFDNVVKGFTQEHDSEYWDRIQLDDTRHPKFGRLSKAIGLLDTGTGADMDIASPVGIGEDMDIANPVGSIPAVTLDGASGKGDDLAGSVPAMRLNGDDLNRCSGKMKGAQSDSTVAASSRSEQQRSSLPRCANNRSMLYQSIAQSHQVPLVVTCSTHEPLALKPCAGGLEAARKSAITPEAFKLGVAAEATTPCVSTLHATTPCAVSKDKAAEAIVEASSPQMSTARSKLFWGSGAVAAAVAARHEERIRCSPNSPAALARSREIAATAPGARSRTLSACLDSSNSLCCGSRPSCSGRSSSPPRTALCIDTEPLLSSTSATGPQPSSTNTCVRPETSPPLRLAGLAAQSVDIARKDIDPVIAGALQLTKHLLPMLESSSMSASSSQEGGEKQNKGPRGRALSARRFGNSRRSRNHQESSPQETRPGRESSTATTPSNREVVQVHTPTHALTASFCQMSHIAKFNMETDLEPVPCTTRDSNTNSDVDTQSKTPQERSPRSRSKHATGKRLPNLLHHTREWTARFKQLEALEPQPRKAGPTI